MNIAIDERNAIIEIGRIEKFVILEKTSFPKKNARILYPDNIVDGIIEIRPNIINIECLYKGGNFLKAIGKYSSQPSLDLVVITSLLYKGFPKSNVIFASISVFAYSLIDTPTFWSHSSLIYKASDNQGKIKNMSN